ncbi:hypothetical protein ACFYY3_14515 [Streptomyces sp. NPDC001812]|uniref:Uncharacterized protein n=1 Tax=Streptomyces cathayae TaxID=3031124 RepID=A0ABY8K076_9ACTN|nr:hypothetical protein [Streptomyces sp. HUAS 5]WGD41657.1 hypothetical protein PYS65_16645 [Streptomyces sp. HUAS 5]
MKLNFRLQASPERRLVFDSNDFVDVPHALIHHERYVSSPGGRPG